MNYVIWCRFSEFLFNCAENLGFWGGPCRNITALCRKIAFFGLRAEILLARSQGLLDSRAGPFLGSVKKYWFFGEIFTSGQPFDVFNSLSCF